MATLVAAAGSIEFPGKINADASGVAIFAELGTNVDTTVSCHLRIAGVEDVVSKDGYAEALVL